MAGSAEPLAPAAPASLVASLNSWCRFGYFSKCGGLEVVGPQHPQVVLDQLGALLLDDQGAGAELRVGVGLVLLADGLDRLGLDAGLGRVVDATGQVAVGADTVRGVSRRGSRIRAPSYRELCPLNESCDDPRADPTPGAGPAFGVSCVARARAGPVDGADPARRRRGAGPARRAAHPAGRCRRGRFRRRPDLLVVKRASGRRARLVAGGRQRIRHRRLARLRSGRCRGAGDSDGTGRTRGLL